MVLLCFVSFSWWRHQMETFSVLLTLCAANSLVPGEFPTQRPVTRSFDVFFDLRQNKRLSRQSWGWWFETPSCQLWRHNDVLIIAVHMGWYPICTLSVSHRHMPTVLLCFAFIVATSSDSCDSCYLFTHIHQGCFVGTMPSICLSQCTPMKQTWRI